MDIKILGIIPARSGSKGLKDKNIKLLDGKPLIAHTIEVAKKSGIIEDVIVSTDSEKYAEISKKYGAEVPFLRSNELSSDTSKISDVILDLLATLKKKYDYFVILQPTSPLRTVEDLLGAYELLEKKQANSVVSVCEVEHSPRWMNTLDENLSMDNFVKEINKNRQELAQYYRINGAIYFMKVDNYLKEQNFYKEKSFAYIMDKKNSVDIDDDFDFMIAEAITKNKKEIKP
ncbi:MAG: cytidylyltransferase domain-containing protein [Fusobacteriaceae bacterium]